MKLGQRDAVANLAVKDLEVAKRFYEQTLGLRPTGGQDGEVIVYESGRTAIFVYRSEYAGTNQATAVTWSVGDAIEEVVKDLEAKGVRFERYEMPGAVHHGAIHQMGDMKVAWFKDPDGNILNVVNQ